MFDSSLFQLLTILLILLLLSNAVTTRRDKSILFSRIVMQNLIFIIYLGFNNLYLNPLGNGIGIRGGLFYVTTFTQSFSMVIILIGLSILTLNSFYHRKLYDSSVSSFYTLYKYYESAINRVLIYFSLGNIWSYFLLLGAALLCTHTSRNTQEQPTSFSKAVVKYLIIIISISIICSFTLPKIHASHLELYYLACLPIFCRMYYSVTKYRLVVCNSYCGDVDEGDKKKITDLYLRMLSQVILVIIFCILKLIIGLYIGVYFKITASLISGLLNVILYFMICNLWSRRWCGKRVLFVISIPLIMLALYSLISNCVEHDLSRYYIEKVILFISYLNMNLSDKYNIWPLVGNSNYCILSYNDTTNGVGSSSSGGSGGSDGPSNPGPTTVMTIPGILNSDSGSYNLNSQGPTNTMAIQGVLNPVTPEPELVNEQLANVANIQPVSGSQVTGANFYESAEATVAVGSSPSEQVSGRVWTNVFSNALEPFNPGRTTDSYNIPSTGYVPIAHTPSSSSFAQAGSASPSVMDYVPTGNNSPFAQARSASPSVMDYIPTGNNSAFHEQQQLQLQGSFLLSNPPVSDDSVLAQEAIANQNNSLYIVTARERTIHTEVYVPYDAAENSEDYPSNSLDLLSLDSVLVNYPQNRGVITWPIIDGVHMPRVAVNIYGNYHSNILFAEQHIFHPGPAYIDRIDYSTYRYLNSIGYRAAHNWGYIPFTPRLLENLRR